jgi:hypothetical protein
MKPDDIVAALGALIVVVAWLFTIVSITRKA